MTSSMLGGTDRLGEKLSQRLSEQVGYRSDLYLGDYRMAGTQLATIGIGYDQVLGQPSGEQIEEFVIKRFQGRIRAHMSSAFAHSSQRVVTLNVTANRVSAAFDSMRQRLACIGPNRYVEAGTNAVWELEDVEGRPVVFRVAEEDLEEILKKTRGSLARSSSVRLADCVEGGEQLVVLNANVAYFDLNGQQRVGTVMSVPDNEGYLTVQHDSQTNRVHYNQVREVLASEGLDGATKTKLERYFTEMFGDKDYAKDLVREAQVVTGTAEEFVAFVTTAGMMDATTALLFVDDLKREAGIVLPAGPKNIPGLVLARWNGNGVEFQLDIEAAESALGQDAPRGRFNADRTAGRMQRDNSPFGKLVEKATKFGASAFESWNDSGIIGLPKGSNVSAFKRWVKQQGWKVTDSGGDGQGGWMIEVVKK